MTAPHPIFMSIVEGWTIAPFGELSAMIDDAAAWANDYGLSPRESAIVSLMIGRQFCVGIVRGDFDYLRPHGDKLAHLPIEVWRARLVESLNASFARDHERRRA